MWNWKESQNENQWNIYAGSFNANSSQSFEWKHENGTMKRYIIGACLSGADGGMDVLRNGKGGKQNKTLSSGTRHKKIRLRGFRPDKTQTGLRSYGS